MNAPEGPVNERLVGGLSRRAWLLLAGLTLLALAVRLWGIGFGLPSLYHSDEPKYVLIAQNIVKTGDPNPHMFNYPSLFFYLNALAYIPYYLIGHLTGAFHSPADIPAPIILGLGVGQAPMPSVFLLGRVLTACFGAGAVALLFAVARRLTGKLSIALPAALFLALSPTNVANSRLITPDTFVVFFTVLALWGAARVFQQGRMRDYLLAGMALGLAASTKYNSALVVLCVLAAHFLRSGWKGYRDRKLYLALGLSAFAFLLTTPFALFDAREFIRDVQTEARHYATGHSGMEGDTLRWYLACFARVEGPVFLFALAELAWSLRRRLKPSLLVAVFPLAYFAFVSGFAVRNSRTAMPLMPFVFLLAAIFLRRILDPGSLWQGRKKLQRLAFGAALLVCLGWTVPRVVQAAVRLNTVDSRETARGWIEQHLPPGSKIAIESYAPYVDPSRFSVEYVDRMIYHPPRWYREEGFEYLVFSQGMFARFFREPEKYAREVEQYEALFQAFEEQQVFSDGGYEVRLYRVPSEP